MPTLSPFWLLLLTLVLPLPFGTDRRGRRIPWVTYTLIGLNVLVYRLTGPDDFLRWGLVPGRPQFWTLLTGMFLHVSFGHLFWNMVFLWLFGPHVEEALGHSAFLLLYLGGGIAAGLLHMAIALLRGAALGDPLVGASGAISAILAPFALRFHRAQIRLFWIPGAIFLPSWGQLEVPAMGGLGLWLLQNLGGGIRFLVEPQAGGVAYWAHIGGFVFGLAAAELTGLLRDGRQDYLLQDARAAAARGEEAGALAVKKYRAFLDYEPENAGVRAELGRLLCTRASGTEERLEATLEMLGAVRDFQKQKDLPGAARCVAETRSLGLTLPLSARERLRLGLTAESGGDRETALFLLRALIAETPDAPEDEMARLKLGQMLQKIAPVEARDVLTEFLRKYPHGEWASRARELISA